MHALDLVSPFRSHGQSIADVDAFDHQHPVLGLNLPGRLDFVALRVDFDLARLQRAGEGAGQSPPGSGHHVVERGCVRRVILGAHAIVLGNLGVNPERHRLRLGRKVGETLRAAETFNPHPGDVGNLAHCANLTGLATLT